MRLRIEYKGAALRDLAQKKEYLETVLKNKRAAQKLAAAVLHTVSLLKSNPHMGAELRGKYDVDTDLRFLIVAVRPVADILAASGPVFEHSRLSAVGVAS